MADQCCKRGLTCKCSHKIGRSYHRHRPSKDVFSRYKSGTLCPLKGGCRFALFSQRSIVFTEINIVHQALRPAVLVPHGFEVASAVCDGTTAVITVPHICKANPCPGCGASSEHVQSQAEQGTAAVLSGRCCVVRGRTCSGFAKSSLELHPGHRQCRYWCA